MKKENDDKPKLPDMPEPPQIMNPDSGRKRQKKKQPHRSGEEKKEKERPTKKKR